MRALRWVVVAVVCVVILGAWAVAGNTPGVADVQRITFLDPIRVGGTLLPQGDYEIRHVMEGDTHVMVFHSLTRKKTPDVRVKCTLVPLAQKADETQKVYVINTAKEEELQELVFKGDTAKHVLER